LLKIEFHSLNFLYSWNFEISDSVCHEKEVAVKFLYSILILVYYYYYCQSIKSRNRPV
jgi:hypothetical protein